MALGSRAKGDAKEGSDIDLSLKGSQLTHRHQLQISEAIEYKSVKQSKICCCLTEWICQFMIPFRFP